MARKRIQPNPTPEAPPAAPVVQAPKPPPMFQQADGSFPSGPGSSELARPPGSPPSAPLRLNKPDGTPFRQPQAPPQAPAPNNAVVAPQAPPQAPAFQSHDGSFPSGPGDNLPPRPARLAEPLKVTYPNQPGGMKPQPPPPPLGTPAGNQHAAMSRIDRLMTPNATANPAPMPQPPINRGADPRIMGTPSAMHPRSPFPKTPPQVPAAYRTELAGTPSPAASAARVPPGAPFAGGHPLSQAIKSTQPGGMAWTQNGQSFPIQGLPVGRLTPDGTDVVLADGSTMQLSAVHRVTDHAGSTLYNRATGAPPAEPNFRIVQPPVPNDHALVPVRPQGPQLPAVRPATPLPPPTAPTAPVAPQAPPGSLGQAIAGRRPMTPPPKAPAAPAAPTAWEVEPGLSARVGSGVQGVKNLTSAARANFGAGVRGVDKAAGYAVGQTPGMAKGLAKGAGVGLGLEAAADPLSAANTIRHPVQSTMDGVASSADGLKGMVDGRFARGLGQLGNQDAAWWKQSAQSLPFVGQVVHGVENAGKGLAQWINDPAQSHQNFGRGMDAIGAALFGPEAQAPAAPAPPNPNPNGLSPEMLDNIQKAGGNPANYAMGANGSLMATMGEKQPEDAAPARPQTADEMNAEFYKQGIGGAAPKAPTPTAQTAPKAPKAPAPAAPAAPAGTAPRSPLAGRTTIYRGQGNAQVVGGGPGGGVGGDPARQALEEQLAYRRDMANTANRMGGGLVNGSDGAAWNASVPEITRQLQQYDAHAADLAMNPQRSALLAAQAKKAEHDAMSPGEQIASIGSDRGSVTKYGVAKGLRGRELQDFVTHMTRAGLGTSQGAPVDESTADAEFANNSYLGSIAGHLQPGSQTPIETVLDMAQNLPGGLDVNSPVGSAIRTGLQRRFPGQAYEDMYKGLGPAVDPRNTLASKVLGNSAGGRAVNRALGWTQNLNPWNGNPGQAITPYWYEDHARGQKYRQMLHSLGFPQMY